MAGGVAHRDRAGHERHHGARSRAAELAAGPLPAAAVPTVFVPGPAKSGTTYLFDCLAATFSPTQVCGSSRAANWSDAACGNRSGFLVTPRVTTSGGQGGSAGCFSPNKENYFWARWGSDRTTTLRTFVGPELPLSRWGRHGECVGKHDVPSLALHGDLPRGEFPFEKHIDDLCLQSDTDTDDRGASPSPSIVRHEPRGDGRSPRLVCDAASALHPLTPIDAPRDAEEEGDGGGGGASSSFDYRAAIPSACRRRCEPCEGHPRCASGAGEGHVPHQHHRRSEDAQQQAAQLPPFACDSRVCTPTYVSRKFRTSAAMNFSAHLRRAWSVSAVPHWRAVDAAGVSRRRLRTLEGKPSIWGSEINAEMILALVGGSSSGQSSSSAHAPPQQQHAPLVPVPGMVPGGRDAVRFVVGLRNPVDLYFSLWSFLTSIGRGTPHGFRTLVSPSYTLQPLRRCNATLLDDVSGVLGMADATRRAYARCINRVPFVTGSTYAVQLLTFLDRFRGDQLLFVPMALLPRTEAQAQHLQEALGAFVGVPLPRTNRPRLCLQKKLVTKEFLRSENATTRDLKARFVASPTGRAVSAYFLADHALLPGLIVRHGVAVYSRSDAPTPS